MTIDQASPSKKPQVLLGVTGSVAAYKAVELIRGLRAFAEVRVVLTAAGSRLVSSGALRKASGHPVWTSLFKGTKPIPAGTPSGTHPFALVPHIEYAKRSDLVLVAPATADFMAKMALGAADDLLSTLCLYATCPLWVAPAMNVNMWNHPAVRKNHATLLGHGVRFLGPENGHLACGDVGEGRFVEPSEVVSQVESHFRNFGKWRGKRVVVTAGPTQEPIDPVRMITNRSSGRMGYALAQAAMNRGADVTLVSGPVRLVPPSVTRLVQVKTASEMRREVLGRFPKADLLIMAAAVSDFRPSTLSRSKIKKTGGPLVLRLEKNPDILAEALAARKPGQKVIGFAAETDRLRENASAKWKRKPCDLLVANRVGPGKIGFESESNECLVFVRGSERPVLLKRDLKSRLAERLLDLLERT